MVKTAVAGDRIMERGRLRMFSVCGAVLLLAGCSSEVLAPSTLVVDGLRLELGISPSSIERQEKVVATLEVENLRDEEVELISSCTALALIKTFRRGERADLEGTALGCGDAITPFQIGAGEVLTRTYEIRAVRVDGMPVERGEYVLRADFMVLELPDLEVSFRVN